MQTLTLHDGVAELGSLTWSASSIEGNWSLAFDLKNTSIAPLLTKGFVDPAKLTDLQLIVLYQGTVF